MSFGGCSVFGEGATNRYEQFPDASGCERHQMSNVSDEVFYFGKGDERFNVDKLSDKKLGYKQYR